MSFAETNIMRADCTAPLNSLNLFERIAFWIHCAKTRNDLRNLDARMLEDIGVTRQQAANEAQRVFWDAPNHWSR